MLEMFFNGNAGIFIPQASNIQLNIRFIIYYFYLFKKIFLKYIKKSPHT